LLPFVHTSPYILLFAQVYKAVLRENGETVALKIQRPACEEIIALDLYVLRWWSGVYNGIFALLNRDIDLQSIIDDFGTLIYREIDYVAEAANAQRFNELYATSLMGGDRVFVPKIYSDFTTNKVLTMEWVDGVRLTDRAALQRYGLDASKLVDTLVQCEMRQILGAFCCVVHALWMATTVLYIFSQTSYCYLLCFFHRVPLSQKTGSFMLVSFVVWRPTGLKFRSCRKAHQSFFLPCRGCFACRSSRWKLAGLSGWSTVLS